ncbi:hypothetical protein [Mucilaginibacter myungsuensis]|uniref:MG2 domain-containing protein n=1 Tax=Mucilaginibacter myungsuensis TaxID=649104 RepID=A0A929PYW9_9SPHI|nr:hypothetical protein [Mucilaginibacter myungsuensis]MBE9663890.1 hypothetical protein [Mucilaginibacter myungsuensis]MDN3598394.1 hypothetical protein [Mucilaginibacter myungsuensis]
MIICLKNACFILLALILPSVLSAQTLPDTGVVRKLLLPANKYLDTYSPEKVYLHLDKPYYAVGDTAWVKAYVTKANGTPAKSIKLYVEVLNSEAQLVQRYVLPVFDGLAQGFVPLTEKQVPQGKYTIRAYTNWQQNFGATSFFYKQLSVGKLGSNTWLVAEQHKREGTDSNRITLAMRFNDAKGAPIVLQPLSVKVMEGKKAILSSNMTTGVDGMLSGKLTLPAKANKRDLSVLVEDTRDKSKSLSFPFYPSGTGGDIDLQFMPEGGSLIAGVYNKVGFKAIGEDGLSREVQGTIVDDTDEVSGTLQSTHKGMGSFVLVPQPGRSYMAKVMVDGKEKLYKLPPAKANGLTLRVEGVNHPGELYVYISSVGIENKNFVLLARSAGAVYFGSAFALNEEGYFNTRIADSKFPTGIVSLAVMSLDGKPVAQRNIFVNHYDGLKIDAMPQTAYATGDSVTLNMLVKSNVGKGAQGSFSVSVTDDAQIKEVGTDSDIQSHLLLASEVAGHIDDAAWYFTPGDEKLKAKALDDLLLTQGWQGFDLAEISKPLAMPLYKAEVDNTVSGKLTNLVKKPVRNAKVILMMKSKTENAVLDTVSDDEGRFRFSDLPLADSAVYLIKLHNKNNKTLAAGITVDDFTPTSAGLVNRTRMAPWNVNADSTLLNYMIKANQKVDQTFVPPSGTLLKQVNIKEKRIVKYVGGEFATELSVIDEKELIAAKKISLMELLVKKYPGFRQSSFYQASVFARPARYAQEQFVVGSMLINDIIADGQSVSDPTSMVYDVSDRANGINSGSDAKPGEMDLSQKISKTTMYDNINTFLMNIGAEDVKNVALYRGTQMYFVIETRGKHGAYTRTSLGTYAHRPLPVQMPKQFYSPKYDVKNPLPDLRSTIHWDPNVISDADGNTQIKFRAAGKPGTYTVSIEGTDMEGHYGVSKQKITIVAGSSGK